MSWLLPGLLCSFALTALGQDNIRNIDFANFDYPWVDPLGALRVRVTNGQWREPDIELLTDDNDATFVPPFAGLTLEEIVYADLTGDFRHEAIVVLRYDTGGTAYNYYLYIYTEGENGPQLIDSIGTGERAYGGLYRVYAERNRMVVEVYDGDKQVGACCSSGLIRTRYRWNGKKFVAVGKSERGTPKTVSRRRVNPFGTPLDQLH